MSNHTVIVVPPYRSVSLVAGIFHEALSTHGADIRCLIRNYDRCLNEVDISFVRDMLLLTPKVIGFSCFFWNLAQNLKLSELAKSLHPQVFTVLGGPQVSGEDESVELLKENPSVDAVVRGEADWRFPELIRRVCSDRDLEGIEGLARRQAGKIIASGVSNIISDLETIPLVYHEHNQYLSQHLQNRDVIPLQTLRGCSEHCIYCSYGSGRLRFFPLDRVEREVAFLCRRKARHVRVCDSHFGGSRERAMTLFKMIDSFNSQTNFYIYPNPQHIDNDYLKKAEAANCRIISLGRQTFDEAVALHINRRLPEAKWWHAFNSVRDHGQDPQLDLMFGLPHQTVDSLCSDLVRMRQNQINHVLFSPLMLFPGTDLAKDEFKRDLSLLDTPQRFAHSTSLPRRQYASMIALSDAYHTLSRFHRTTWFLDTQYKERSPQSLDRWFRSLVKEYRSELLCLMETLNTSSAHIKDHTEALYTRVLSLYSGLFSSDEMSSGQLAELVRMDSLEIAMRQRQSELSRDILPHNPAQSVVLLDDLVEFQWMINDESWFETHDLPYRFASKGQGNPTGFSTEPVHCVYHCPTGEIHFADAKDADLLQRFERASILFDARNIYSSETLKRFAKWVKLGVLVRSVFHERTQRNQV